MSWMLRLKRTRKPTFLCGASSWGMWAGLLVVMMLVYCGGLHKAGPRTGSGRASIAIFIV